jgi:hypothetical protein
MMHGQTQIKFTKILDYIKNGEGVWVLSEIRQTVPKLFFSSEEDLLLANNCSFFEQMALKTGQNNSCFH